MGRTAMGLGEGISYEQAERIANALERIAVALEGLNKCVYEDGYGHSSFSVSEDNEST